MIKISKSERNALQEVGLIKERKVNSRGIIYQDANLVVCNKEHVGKNSKTYYVVETFEVLAFLGKFDKINVQKINEGQLNVLINKGYTTLENIQTYGTYIPNALVYKDMFGQYYVRKIAKVLLDCGIWSNSKTKKEKLISVEGNSNLFEEDLSMEDLLNS